MFLKGTTEIKLIVSLVATDRATASYNPHKYEDDELFQGLPDDNFRHRYAIDLKDIGYMRQTKELEKKTDNR